MAAPATPEVALPSVATSTAMPSGTTSDPTDVTEQPAPDPAYKLAGFALMWFAITYFPYFLVFYYGRVTYPFYILPAIPAMAIGCAYLLTRSWFSRDVAYILLGGVFLWFFLYYPDKSFLPIWLRVLLGH